MSLFDDILKDSECLFLNPLALDYEFVPPIIKFRENQQQYIATCIKPLFQDRTGKNLFIFGAPGIGKTVATKHVLKQLEEETEEIKPIYINCWKKDTSYKVALEICNQINYKWVQNRKTDELLEVIAKIVNKKATVICLDEIDKLKDLSILYFLIEDIYKKTILLITNEKSWYNELDNRLKSRLNLDLLEFKPYNLEETKEIIKQRIEYAFIPNLWDKNLIEIIANKAFGFKDIRTGIFLLKETGDIAESKSSKKINLEHINEALSKLEKFRIKSSADLTLEEKEILELIKNNPNSSITDIHKKYSKDISDKTFRRRLDSLKKAKLIEIEETKGKPSLVRPSIAKKLTDF